MSLKLGQLKTAIFDICEVYEKIVRLKMVSEDGKTEIITQKVFDTIQYLGSSDVLQFLFSLTLAFHIAY